jgi:holo-[acyl-carrier protein] synthase
MLAVGVDIVDVNRIAEIVERWGERFLQRVYTERELACCAGRANSLAARWAAKEAASKALGCGWLDMQWTDIEVMRQPTGQPQLAIHGRALARAQILGVTEWAIS